jgi:hypothetical protein
MERNKDYFEGIVGQDVAKAKLSFLMKSYEATSILPVRSPQGLRQNYFSKGGSQEPYELRGWHQEVP